MNFSDMDKQKSWLVDTLVVLGTAQADAFLEKQKDTSEKSVLVDITVKDVDDTMQEIQKWCDVSDAKVRLSSLSMKITMTCLSVNLILLF